VRSNIHWLVNVVMVKKKNGKCRMCTYFTDLNKCCPKDDFLFSRIDKVVDSAADCEAMTLLDYFSGYHQFVSTRKMTKNKLYCGTIPKGIKNVGPTFYRMTKAIFKDQMHRNIFAYIDDIVAASKKKATQIDDLAETFVNMRGAQLKVNSKKCVFDAQRGKVLGYLVSVNGIKASPDKFNAIVHMKPPQSKKEVQRLIGIIVALNRFMSKLAERSLPFFTVLRGSGSF
jgi:hypothetical protein